MITRVTGSEILPYNTFPRAYIHQKKYGRGNSYLTEINVSKMKQTKREQVAVFLMISKCLQNATHTVHKPFFSSLITIMWQL